MYSILRIILLIFGIHNTVQHGYLADPPQRSSLWRENADAPVNYNDNQLFCGGSENMRLFGGKCGSCGDPYQGPRENEAGGKYALGIIARKYPSNQRTLLVKVVLTAYHKGYYEFKICPNNDPHLPVSQRCLDKYPLKIIEGSRRQRTRYYPRERGTHELNLVLPRGMQCSQCVLQWRYKTGNSWGIDNKGRGCMGCGNQEEFWNCADIQIGYNRYQDPYNESDSKESFEQSDSSESVEESDSTESEEDIQRIGATHDSMINHLFSPFSTKGSPTWGSSEESDSDEKIPTRTIPSPKSLSMHTVNFDDNWSQHLKTNVVSEIENIHQGETAKQEPNPWSKITNQNDKPAKIAVHPNSLQRINIKQPIRHETNRFTNDFNVFWQPPSLRNPLHVEIKSPNNIRQSSRTVNNRMFTTKRIITPVSPFMGLLGGQSAQLHFSFLPEHDLQLLNFFGK